MGKIVEQGSFSSFETIRLDEARSEIPSLLKYSNVISVFLSHHHDDLLELKGVIGFLQSTYGIKVYIDSNDPSLPKKTSGETARAIKNRIVGCKKFILLATEGAIESKWCNWELGYGDAQKYQNDNMAIFPIKPKGIEDNKYKGNEYLQIYPYIAYYDGTTFYKDGGKITAGYYICKRENDSIVLTRLGDWFAKK